MPLPDRPATAPATAFTRASVAWCAIKSTGSRHGERPVRMSPDQRQGLCYQCHAPLSTRQAGSSSDRTGNGIHEGIGCLACPQKHGPQTRASCANCHPRLSNCGLDVEKMDTTFLSPKSAHNIHSAKCVDCHMKGVPKKRVAARM